MDLLWLFVPLAVSVLLMDPALRRATPEGVMMTGIHAAAGGGAGVAITLAPTYTIQDFRFDPSTATAEFRLESDFDIISFTQNSGTIDEGNWMDPVGGDSAANYEVRATNTGGSDPSGSALNTWLSLSSNRSWNQSQGGPGTTAGTLLIEIRHATTLVVMDSATVELTANVEI